MALIRRMICAYCLRLLLTCIHKQALYVSICTWAGTVNIKCIHNYHTKYEFQSRIFFFYKKANKLISTDFQPITLDCIGLVKSTEKSRIGC